MKNAVPRAYAPANMNRSIDREGVKAAKRPIGNRRRQEPGKLNFADHMVIMAYTVAKAKGMACTILQEWDGNGLRWPAGERGHANTGGDSPCHHL